MQNDYKTYARIRDRVIQEIIPENEQAEITGVMRSIELALITTEPGKKMKVTREGTEVFELYIRYLENKVMTLMNLSVDDLVSKTLSKTIPCPKCKGVCYITQQQKKKRVPIHCPECNGYGTIEKEIQCG